MCEIQEEEKFHLWYMRYCYYHNLLLLLLYIIKRYDNILLFMPFGKVCYYYCVLRYDGQKSAQSIQEEIQKTEDKYLKENFYIRDSVFDLHEAVIKTSVMEELRFVDNHIIIIGKVSW